VTTARTDRPSRAGGRPDAVLHTPNSTPITRSLASETGYLLRRAYVEAGRRATAAMPEGAAIRDYEVLQTLADLGPSSQRRLSELLWVNRTVMVKLIDALEAAGFVERRRDPADRRSYALELTRAGELARARLSTAADEAEGGLTSALSAQDRTALRKLLSAIALAADQPPELATGLAGRTGFLHTHAHNRVRELTNARLGALGITTALYGVLATIARGPISQQAIADQLGLTGPAIVQAVDRLEAAGLVERRRDPSDRRSYALEPSSRGQATLREARSAIAQINEQLDKTLGGLDKRRELNGLLLKLLRPE
jgi:DNA-binding MarR family transcriptional regulator